MSGRYKRFVNSVVEFLKLLESNAEQFRVTLKSSVILKVKVVEKNFNNYYRN